MEQNVYKRLTKVEAMANLQKSQLVEVLQNAYNAACLAKDEQAAADAARALRNKLLDLSDKEMSLDRLGLDISSTLTFLTSLSSIFSGEWAVYRQSLRDIPQQDGFPFDIIFPVSPNETNPDLYLK